MAPAIINPLDSILKTASIFLLIQGSGILSIISLPNFTLVPASLTTNGTDKLVSFAASKGFRKFAALIPRGRFGDRVALDFAASVKKSGGLVVRSARYGSTRSSILAAVKFLGDYYHQKGPKFKTSGIFSKKQDFESLSISEARCLIRDTNSLFIKRPLR